MSLEEAARNALAALERYQIKRQDFDRFADEIESLRAALAETERAEPVAWVPIHPRSGPLWSMATDHPDAERLPSYPLREVYFHPPRRELSDGELAPLVQKAVADVYGFCGAMPSKNVLAVVSAVLREVGQTERRELSDEELQRLYDEHIVPPYEHAGWLAFARAVLRTAGGDG